MDEWAIFFDNGVWLVMLKTPYAATKQSVCRTLEEAIMEVALRTNAQVGIKLITKQND